MAVFRLCRSFPLLLAIACAANAGTLLIHDDFTSYRSGSDASPMWKPEAGDWKVTADGLVGSDCEGGFIAEGARSGRKEWTDYVLTVRLKVLSRSNDWRDGAWLGFRALDSANAYTLGFYDRATALHKVSRGRLTGDENPLAQSPTTIKDNEWHDVKVSVVGRKIAVSLDGKPLLEATDEGWNDSPPLASGGIVLAARAHDKAEGHTRVTFRDVRVEAVGDVPPSLAFTLADARKQAEARREQVSVLEFLKSRRGRRLVGVPHKVLAFYYTWYGRPERHGRWLHWGEVKPEARDISASRHYPTAGAYDSLDPTIIAQHVELAKGCGIDAFISTWWGRGDVTDQAFAKLLDIAKAKGFKATIYWETVPGKGQAKIDRAVNDLAYVLDTYGSHPAFLEADGKPVIFVYGRVMGEVELSEWPEIIALARERSGKDFLLIADGYREDYARLFDGVHTYNPCGWVVGKKPDALAAASKASFASAVAVARHLAKLSCITVIPGYDDTKVRTPGLDAERQDGETYRVLWQQAIAADPDWVLITSWNEWHEGSEIEPSWEDGDKYIKMTAAFARQFKSAPMSRVPVPEAPAGTSAESVAAMQRLFKDKTIGILPGFGGKVVFWLLDAGVSLRELSWRDLLDPAILNPKALPVVVYAGYEEYVQSVKEPGDVDKAIQRYLAEGGVLMVLPTGPFPFYYNENREAVNSSHKFGLTIGASRQDNPKAAGWEKPPEGAKLTFKLDAQRLPGLPATAPFPETGDLRWRPATRGAAEGEAYLPLATLIDGDGNRLGDGIALVRLEGRGTILYAWMRMPDVLDPDTLFAALFRLCRACIPARGIDGR